LLPFFERYNWGRECRTSVIYLSHYDLMSHSPTHISIHDVTT
jgi:hypothetical protein